MLRAAVSLDAKSKECVRERRVKVGENFDVIVTIWDDGKGGSPAVFDTFISEVWYNDQGIIVQMDLNKPPTAAALADNSHTTVDAFSLDRVFKTDPRLPKDSLEFGTPLTRLDPTIHPAGLRSSAMDLWKIGAVLRPGYQEATGRAGLSDFQKPFKISPELGVISAVGGRASARKDAHAVQAGETNMIPVCQAFLGSQPVPVNSEVSTLRVYSE